MCVSVGTRVGGKVHVFSLFKEEVIVPMFDLHFRKIQVQGFWLSQASNLNEACKIQARRCLLHKQTVLCRNDQLHVMILGSDCQGAQSTEAETQRSTCTV